MRNPFDWPRGPFPAGFAFNLASMFFNGEQGKTFEPWDMTTLYQDRAGTTPVTAVGQVVGYRRDKSGRGNHDVAISDAARGVYGREPKGGTRNLLTWTEDLSNAAWVANGATKSLVSGKQKLVESVGSGLHGVKNSGGFQPTGAFTTVVRLEAAERSLAEIWIGNSSPAVGAGVRFDLSNGTFVSSRGVGGDTVTDYEITEFSPGVYDCSVTVSHVTTDTQTHIFAIASGTATSTVVYTGDGVSGIYIHQAQLEPGSSATAYQKVTTAYDVTEAGVASCYYVQTDGVDDAYVTPTITPGTDKAQIFMGLKKLNDTTSILMELSASAGPNAGTFYALTGPDTGPLGSVNGYSSLSRGSAAATALQTAQIVQAAPDYAVVVATHDIAGDLSTIERNGVAGTSGTADKGTGNFLAYPVYVYARGGTTLPAAVRDYGHAFRFGPNLSASTIAQARTLIVANTPTVTL